MWSEAAGRCGHLVKCADLVPVRYMSEASQDLVPIPFQPDLDRIKALVLDSVPSPHSRRAYDRALTDFPTWSVTEGAGEGSTKTTVQRYARQLEQRGLAASTWNVRLTAVRRVCC
jgi:site-specific recombinase XerC